MRGANHRAIAHLAPGRAVKLLPLAQKRQNLVDSVFDEDPRGRSKIDISGCIDNRPLIEPELPSRFLGVGSLWFGVGPWVVCLRSMYVEGGEIRHST